MAKHEHLYATTEHNNVAYAAIQKAETSRIPSSFLNTVAQLFPQEHELITKKSQQDTFLKPNNFDELLTYRSLLATGQGYFVRDTATTIDYLSARNRKDYGDNHEIKRLMRGRNIHIWPNEFPFDVPADTKHAVLWVNTKLITETQRNIYLASWMMAKDLTENDMVIRLNPEFNRSIPTMRHYHLFYRVSPDELLEDCP